MSAPLPQFSPVLSKSTSGREFRPRTGGLKKDRGFNGVGVWTSGYEVSECI